MDPSEDGSRPLELEDRIRNYARYFALIQKQHEALDRDDVAEVISLTDERERLARKLPPPDDLAASDDPMVQRLVVGLRARLVEGFRSHEALVDRMKSARSELASEIGGLEARTDALRAYIREEAPATEKRVDVRL